MLARRRQTTGKPHARHCTHWLKRGLRAVVPCLAAYALAANLILLAFATTVMSAGASMTGTVVVAQGEGRPAVRLAMVLCRPGAAWSDAFDADDATAPGDAHQRQCCGICALQGAGLPGPADTHGLLMPEWRAAGVPVPVGEEPHLAPRRLSPPARAPPGRTYAISLHEKSSDFMTVDRFDGAIPSADRKDA